MRNNILFLVVGVLLAFGMLAYFAYKAPELEIMSDIKTSALSLISSRYSELEARKIELAQAKIETGFLKEAQKRESMIWWSQFLKIIYISGLIIFGLSIFISANVGAIAFFRRATITKQQYGDVILEIPYSQAASKDGIIDIQRTALAKVTSGVLDQENMLKLFAITTRIVRGNPKQEQNIIDVNPENNLQMLPAGNHVPSFHEMLSQGIVAYKRPMVLGYHDTQPIHGSFLDIYSSAIAGETGSGKTSTQLYLIGSGLITEHARYYCIDPHYPHPQSLAYKTRALWEQGLIRMATVNHDMLDVLEDINYIIDLRLRQIDTDTTPVILVIDELVILRKSTVAPKLINTMERVSTEGRKVQVYMLASSQTWLASKTGSDSAARDTLTSAYVHRIKPKQANLLLQDKESVNMVRSLHSPGEAVFVPVGHEPKKVIMPLATEYDMEYVAKIVGGHPYVVSMPQKQVVPCMDMDSDKKLNIDTLSALKLEIDKGKTQKEISAEAGIDEGHLSRILSGKQRLTEEAEQKLNNVVKIDFERG